MARIVVTGGAGFLGSHITDALLARGDEVVVLDNLVTGSTRNIEHLFGHPGFTFVRHDVSQHIWVPGPVDAILHFASPASPIDYLELPIQTLKVGSLGTHNALGLARAKGARFMLASTSEVYGDPTVHPQPETYWGNVNPIGPRGVYDEAKRFAEAITLAYHRTHDLDVRIVRIFNSILADEQVLYDDGRTLRREPIAALAARLGHTVDLDGYTVPAFGEEGRVTAAETVALVGHPPTGPCYEVRTAYGRSIRVTGDHSLFVEGQDGKPVARKVCEIQPGTRVALAGRIEVPERDRRDLDIVELLCESGASPWDVLVVAPALGRTAWERRDEIFSLCVAERRPSGPNWRNGIWSSIIRMRDDDEVPARVLQALAVDVATPAAVRLRRSPRRCSLPIRVQVTDELLWVLGLFVAEGCVHESSKGSLVNISCDDDVLDRVQKVVERDLGCHVVRAPGSTERAPSLIVNSNALVAVWRSLDLTGEKSIPGWVLGLPLDRLGWFLEGYREGDGVHSGKKLMEGRRHEFSTVSEALKDDLVIALGRFGLVPSVGRYSSRIRERTGDREYPFWRLTVADCSPWSPLQWSSGVVQRLNARRTGDLVWAVVKSVEEVEATDLVYDFCVPGRENFLAGGGIMAHNTYGPRMRANDGRVVSNFIVQALRGEPLTIYGDGTQTRSFCFVEDEVRGFLALLDGPHVGPINIGNDGEFTMLELAEVVKEVTGSSSPVEHRPLPVDDPRQRRPDLTLARELLGWEPTIDLREGVARTAAYFAATLDDQDS